jgi:hypothetical protein
MHFTSTTEGYTLSDYTRNQEITSMRELQMPQVTEFIEQKRNWKKNLLTG